MFCPGTEWPVPCAQSQAPSLVCPPNDSYKKNKKGKPVTKKVSPAAAAGRVKRAMKKMNKVGNYVQGEVKLWPKKMVNHVLLFRSVQERI